MKRFITLITFLILSNLICVAQTCVECHQEVTPEAVNDWKLSKHAANDVDCSVCHGEEHTTNTDYEKVQLPTLETCSACHDEKVEQFKKGKHAVAWVAMNAMPTAHMQPMATMEGMKGCGGCHKLGVKSEAEIKSLKDSGSKFGNASCDACHTRHLFSVKEAAQPQACQTCHQGFDHPQWEMYSSSKHGVRYLLKQSGVLQEEAAAPTCQTCHMIGGNHEVRTAWGFLAVRLPLPDDEEWKADQVTILEALGVLDPQGNPTPRLDVVKAGDVARLTKEAFDIEREKMLKVCGDCHSSNFAKAEIEKGDRMIREADRIMAEGIRIIAGLYRDKVLPKPETYKYAFPDLLAFHDAPTVIEQKLFVMFLKHRMRTFQGAFHNNPDYTLWYGWSELQRDITELKELARELRAEHK